MEDLEKYQKIERTTLTMEETAKYLGISYWLVGQLTRKGEIPHAKIGGKVLFRKKTLDEFFSDKELKSLKRRN